MTKTNQMFRVAMGIAIAGALGGTALAQQSISSLTGISYQQDFDNTGGSGNGGFGNALDFNTALTDYTTLPTGWVLSGSSGNYQSSTGSLSTADHYSFGSSTASAERALGGVSNSSSLIFGAIFQNSTGRPSPRFMSNTPGSSGVTATMPRTGWISPTRSILPPGR